VSLGTIRKTIKGDIFFAPCLGEWEKEEVQKYTKGSKGPMQA